VNDTADSSRPRAAAAERRPTGDASRFLIPSEQLPPGFAERLGQPGFAPAEPRPAATVVLLRDAPGGPEALLLRRPKRSSFAAGAWVFPGGVVDAADAEPALAARSRGPDPDAWARRLGLADPAEAFGFVVAALREAWEETGILLAEPEAEEPDAGKLHRARIDLLSGVLSLAAMAERERLLLATEDLLYIAHWITPEPEPRRYDTRFFLARVGAGAECELHGEELKESRWVRPADAVAAYRAGELLLLPPTVHTLDRLAGFGSLEELWTGLRDAPVPTFLPRMRRDPAGILLEIGRMDVEF
jgi:8-oxo-dGTP pyrophosphatase MutT (NUDIX family)